MGDLGLFRGIVISMLVLAVVTPIYALLTNAVLSVQRRSIHYMLYSIVFGSLLTAACFIVTVVAWSMDRNEVIDRASEPWAHNYTPDEKAEYDNNLDNLVDDTLSNLNKLAMTGCGMALFHLGAVLFLHLSRRNMIRAERDIASEMLDSIRFEHLQQERRMASVKYHRRDQLREQFSKYEESNVSSTHTAGGGVVGGHDGDVGRDIVRIPHNDKPFESNTTIAVWDSGNGNSSSNALASGNEHRRRHHHNQASAHSAKSRKSKKHRKQQPGRRSPSGPRHSGRHPTVTVTATHPTSHGHASFESHTDVVATSLNPSGLPSQTATVTVASEPHMDLPDVTDQTDFKQSGSNVPEPSPL
jgi:hypothetical protein